MKHILFVDDESTVLDGIRRALHAERSRWEMQFVQSAEAALQACERQSFDVVVSDMRMPGTDGAALLSQIRSRFPEATRIVLSGYSEPSFASRAASDAHRVLAKPCNVSELRAIIERVVTLRDLVDSAKIRQMVGGVGKLPSLSSTYSLLTDAVRDPYCSLEQVSAIIERDVAMAAKVLQLTNSAFFGLSQHIASLSMAISYLGVSTIKSLALTSEVFKVFKPGPGIPLSVCDSIEAHAVRVSAIAGALPVPPQNRDAAMIAGLLHDIGKLFLASKMCDEYRAITARIQGTGCRSFEAEEEILGTSHAELGAYLLGLWGIPELAVEAIAYHHHPGKIPHSGFDCIEALYIADLLAHEMEAGSVAPTDVKLGERDRALLDELGLRSRIPEFRELALEACRQPE